MSRLIDADAFIDYLGFENTQEEREENFGEIVTLNDFDRQPTACDVDKVVDACAEVVSKIPGLCGKHCPIDCHYFTEQSCKESWKLYLEEHLKEGEKDAGNI